MKTVLLNNWLMIFLVIITWLIITMYGCRKNDPVEEITGKDTIKVTVDDTIKEKPVYLLDTAHINAILGKWVIVAVGNWPGVEPVEKPSHYSEYLKDSILKVYDYETGELAYTQKYWFDSLLHEDTTPYYFQFYNDSLRLDYAEDLAIFNTFIYKQIK